MAFEDCTITSSRFCKYKPDMHRLRMIPQAGFLYAHMPTVLFSIFSLCKTVRGQYFMCTCEPHCGHWGAGWIWRRACWLSLPRWALQLPPQPLSRPPQLTWPAWSGLLPPHGLQAAQIPRSCRGSKALSSPRPSSADADQRTLSLSRYV